MSIQPQDATRQAFFWSRAAAQISGGAASPTLKAQLAAARRAQNSSYGLVAELWPLYSETALEADRYGTTWIVAEHATLGLYGLHQQGHSQPMYQTGRSLGSAALELFNRRNEGTDRLKKPQAKFDDSVGNRLAAFNAARTPDVALRQLTSLIQQMSGHSIALDHTEIFYFLLSWDNPDKRNRKLQRWSLDYIRKPAKKTSQTKDS